MIDKEYYNSYLKSSIVSRENIHGFEEYKKLILKWNEKINLISKNTIEDFEVRHIIDSLQLANFINDLNIHIVDIGSGGGFPGIILSIIGVKKVTLIESDARKAAFLLQASLLSSNKIEVLNTRVEELNMKCDIVTCRAFASLDRIFNFTKKFVIADKYLILKGEKSQSEIEDSKLNWKFDWKIHDSITSKNGKILEINKVEKIA